jgi:vancomycin permeability regulator SanA
MFFYVSKVLYFLLCPLTWIVILLIIGVFIKNAARARKIFIAALIALLCFSNSALIDEMLRLWEVPYANTQNGQHYEAGIVLGGGMVTFDKDYDRLIFRENTDRFLQALDLYKKGIIKKIIVCGGPGSIVFRETIEGLLIER